MTDKATQAGNDTIDQRPPEIYDHAEAPDGYRCQMWSPDESGEMQQCEKDADVLFVYEGNLNDDTRRNAFACSECAPVEIADDDLDTSYTFDECPSCGGRLYYPARGECICDESGDEFAHQIATESHLLWSYTDDYGLKEVVARE